MTIPDSLQTIGNEVFDECSKLVPSRIDIDNVTNHNDVTEEVVHHLRTTQVEIVKLKVQISEKDRVNAALKSKTNELTKTNAELAGTIAKRDATIDKQATAIVALAAAIANLSATAMSK
ncbi:hypothetical protein TrVE_jg5538 [Triparma verrucosa]|uniref:Uncharacterized protein n=1 Tax=Triparma verrucosa TaxID=1606542 RepID=A0A9W7BI60_9STRA|nr:hypothetical protein TrVE_jg5538 [Triparma verrucosa]